MPTTPHVPADIDVPDTSVDHSDTTHHFVKKKLIKDVAPPVVKEPTRAISASRLNERLVEIYENSDGSMPDMTRFEKRQRNRFVTAFFVLLSSAAFLAGVAWVGFFVWPSSGHFSEQDVTLSITGNEYAGVGQAVQYHIVYHNAEHVPLQKIGLHLRYPTGFVFTKSSQPSANDTHDTWILGSLEGGADRSIDISGFLYAHKGESPIVQAFLNYRPGNFSADFQKVASITTVMNDSPIEVQVVGDTEANSGTETPITITLNTKNNLLPPRLSVGVSGSHMTLRGSVPEPDAYHTARWTFVAPKNGQTITTRGIFTAEAGGTEGTMDVQVLGYPFTGARADEGVVYATSSYHVSLVPTGNSPVHVTVNGASDDASVAPGDMLSVHVSLKNTTTTAMKNAVMRVIFEAPSFDKKSILQWAKVTDEHDGDVIGEQIGSDVRRGTISWTAKEVSALKQLDPGQEVSIDFSLPIKTSAEANLTTFSSSDISIHAEAQADGVDKKKPLIFSDRPVHLTINSDVTIDAHDTVNVSAGKETHALTWVLSNHFHLLQGVRLEADIYGDFVWHGEALVASLGTATFDAVAKKLVWSIPELPASTKVLTLPFSLTLNKKNPTQKNLLSKIQFHGTDTVTNQEMTKTGPEVLLR